MYLVVVVIASGLTLAASETPSQQLDRALSSADPAPALRAAFRATVSSGNAVRQIEFDPLQGAAGQFRLLSEYGEDTELDSIVNDWAAEPQPDVRLFADDLRPSLGRGRIVQEGDWWRAEFKHRLSSNDDDIDAMVSNNMRGNLVLDRKTGMLSKLEYRLIKPIRTSDGAVVKSYAQSYTFAHSVRWGVTFVSGYSLHATGGKYGVRGSRSFQVKITDVAFSFAGDARQQLASKPVELANQTPALYAGADLR